MRGTFEDKAGWHPAEFQTDCWYWVRYYTSCAPHTTMATNDWPRNLLSSVQRGHLTGPKGLLLQTPICSHKVFGRWNIGWALACPQARTSQSWFGSKHSSFLFLWNVRTSHTSKFARSVSIWLIWNRSLSPTKHVYLKATWVRHRRTS